MFSNSQSWLSNFIYLFFALARILPVCSAEASDFLFFSYFLILLSVIIVWFSSLLGQGFMLYLLLIALGVCFFTTNLLTFYIAFELALLPLFVIILVGGRTPERLKAI